MKNRSIIHNITDTIFALENSIVQLLFMRVDISLPILTIVIFSNGRESIKTLATLTPSGLIALSAKYLEPLLNGFKKFYLMMEYFNRFSLYHNICFERKSNSRKTIEMVKHMKIVNQSRSVS